MLCEAARCGIKLDMKGIAALYKTVPIRAQNLIPQELTSRLEAELSGDVLGRYEHHKARIEELLNDFLRVEQLVQIVETAAAYDAVVDTGSFAPIGDTVEIIVPPGSAGRPDDDEAVAVREEEILAVAQRYMKDVREGTRNPERSVKGIKGPNGEMEALDGGPIGPDGLKDPKESLSVWWIPLEVMLLQTGRYGPGTYAERTRWR